MTTLKQITIDGLRGSIQRFSLPFEKGKGVTIIYGENGTGKSTVCDGFEFIGKGTVGSLDGRGLGQTTGYWPSMDKELADISVKLETTTGVCEARVGKGGAVIATPADQRPTVEVFRRRQILEPIEAKPGDRYEAIKRFIDVSGVETSESTLRALIKDLKASQNFAAARVLENRDEIERLWDTAGRSGIDAFSWAEVESNRDSAVVAAEANALDALHLAYKTLEQHPGLIATSAAALTAAQSRETEARVLVQQQVEAVAADASEVVAILEAARPYLAQHPSLEACPLCESAERAEELGVRVDARLESFKALRAAQGDAAAVAAAAAKALGRLETEGEAAVRDAKAFEFVRASHGWPKEIQLPPHQAPEDLMLLKEWLADTALLAAGWERERDRRRASGLSLTNVREALANWESNTKTAEEIAAVLPRLEAALRVAEEERRSFTDDVLSEISDEVGRLYEQIHPGEGLGKISLELDPKRRASLGIGADFHGKPLKPQAYFSDSHLDTLGLCVLLALASKEAPEQKILVLDDVLASADEPHVERLIDVVYSEAAKFRHCVITTHYRPWKEKLRWGLLKTGQCHFVELSHWSIGQGITLTGSVPEIQRLRDLLVAAQPDLQSICAKAGVILEAALDFLTRLYECRVPRRRTGALTIGDLLGAINNKLREALRVDIRLEIGPDGASTYKAVPLGPLLDNLGKIAQSRNLFGCHFNELSFHLPDADALGFGTAALALAEALVDLEDGWPRSDKSGSYWATSGDARRLHPLKQPM